MLLLIFYGPKAFSVSTNCLLTKFLLFLPKILLILSSTGTGVGLAIFGTFTYMKDVLNNDVSSFNWIPIVSFSFVVFSASWGLLTLPFLVVTEILPEKVNY